MLSEVELFGPLKNEHSARSTDDLPYLSDDEVECIVMESDIMTNVIEVPESNEVRQMSKIPTEPEKPLEALPLAQFAVFQRMNLMALAILELIIRSKAVQNFLGLSDDWERFAVTSNELDRKNFQLLPADEDPTPENLTRVKYRLFFEPPGKEKNPLFNHMRAAGYTNLLKYLVCESGALEEEPSIKHVTDAFIANTSKGGTGLMNPQSYMKILEEHELLSLDEETKRTQRDLKNLITSLPLAFPEGIAWGIGLKVMQRTFDAARELPPGRLASSALKTELMIPEVLGLDAETTAQVKIAFRKHEELFVNAYERIRKQECQPQSYDAIIQENEEHKDTLPHFPLADEDKLYKGPILVRRVTVPEGDPIVGVMTKVLRRITTLVLEQREDEDYTTLIRAPLLALRFFEDGRFILENDVGRKLDFAPILTAIRRMEIEAREDLTDEEKHYALSDDDLLRANQAEYAIGKFSYVRMMPNGLRLGNGFDKHDTPLPVNDDAVWMAIINAIEATRKEIG